jgi:hypothetical protein
MEVMTAGLKTGAVTGRTLEAAGERAQGQVQQEEWKEPGSVHWV